MAPGSAGADDGLTGDVSSNQGRPDMAPEPISGIKLKFCASRNCVGGTLYGNASDTRHAGLGLLGDTRQGRNGDTPEQDPVRTP